MTLSEAVTLIHTNKNIPKSIWADLGCGSGLFTYALASLLPKGSSIYAVDKNINAFVERENLDDILIKKFELDFEKDKLPFADIDGILMANSLHFINDKNKFIARLRDFQRLSTLLIVEYDTDVPNRWVPYSISFSSLKKTFAHAGYASVIKINEMPSAFKNGNLYSAIVHR